MAGTLNKVFLMGNLTRDIELRDARGTPLANFSIAINKKYTTKGGESRDETSFIDCVAWGKTAETMAKYLGKGKPVLIEGELKQERWEDKNTGNKRSKVIVNVFSFKFVDHKEKKNTQHTKMPDQPQNIDEDFQESDIPF